MSVGGLSTSAWLLGLLRRRNDARAKHLVLVGRCDAELVQFFLHYIHIRNLDLVPNLLELIVEVFN